MQERFKEWEYILLKVREDSFVLNEMVVWKEMAWDKNLKAKESCRFVKGNLWNGIQDGQDELRLK